MCAHLCPRCPPPFQVQWGKCRVMHTRFGIPAWRHEKKLCDRLGAVGYVGGKYLVPVDADNYMFALFFAASWIQLLVLVRATYCNGFKRYLRKGLEQWCSQTFWFGWSKTRIPRFAHKFKDIFINWRHFGTIWRVLFNRPTWLCKDPVGGSISGWIKVYQKATNEVLVTLFSSTPLYLLLFFPNVFWYVSEVRNRSSQRILKFFWFLLRCFKVMVYLQLIWVWIITPDP